MTYKTAFGHNMPVLQCPNARKWHWHDPCIVQKYVEEYEKLVKWHNLHEQVCILEEKAKYPLSPSLAEEYEELDSIRCNITYMAEKKCRKRCKGQVSFSPELQLTSRHIATWSLLRSKAMGGKFSSRLISQTLEKASIPSSAHSFSLVEMEAASTAFVTFYAVKKNHNSYWSSHLESLAKALALNKDTKKLTILYQLQEREHQRSVARKICFA